MPIDHAISLFSHLKDTVRAYQLRSSPNNIRQTASTWSARSYCRSSVTIGIPLTWRRFNRSFGNYQILVDVLEYPGTSCALPTNPTYPLFSGTSTLFLPHSQRQFPGLIISTLLPTCLCMPVIYCVTCPLNPGAFQSCPRIARRFPLSSRLESIRYHNLPSTRINVIE